MKILMLPSMHPYVSKLSYEGKITIVNPNTDYFSDPNFGVNFIERKHPPCTYDIVHIHFSFDKVSLETLKGVLAYFKKIHKPIVWTCHSKESQRIKNYFNGEYQRLLFHEADKIITLTNGCREWISTNWGKHRNSIEVIPHGLVAFPDDVKKYSKDVNKNNNRYTILYGEFRENKERIKALSEFLINEKLSGCEIRLIYKNQTAFERSKNREWEYFQKLTSSTRCSTLVKSWISNEELIREFYSSHCIILPYLWGTHSGQIELAKDCGCYVVAPNVGFYTEQWERTILWGDNCKCKTYKEALEEVASLPMLFPIGAMRVDELHKIIEQHLNIYKELFNSMKVISSSNKF